MNGQYDMEPFYEGGQPSPGGDSGAGNPNMKGISAMFSKNRSNVTTPNDNSGVRSESETILEGIKASQANAML